jgi:negative regulator of sigma-B (phosphoserine phosphatase)
MREASVDASPVIDWGVAASALPGQTQSGDLHLVKPVSTGVLMAVVDGLGHGAEAATAARTAVTTLEEHASESLLALLQRCHWALKGSRGVVMSLAFANRQQNALTWAGVGNVECMLFHPHAATQATPSRASLVTRGGIVGSELPQVRAQVLPLAAGDLLIFATDGIREGFSDGLQFEAPPQQLAEHILSQHGKGTDDALVLVARYRGGTRTSG